MSAPLVSEAPDPAVPDAGAPGPEPFATEATPIGPQTLIPGVAPITARDRLQGRADAPLEPNKPQRPCDLGLFDVAARRQLDLFLHGARP